MNSYDKKLSDRIKNHKSFVDHDALWNDLQKRKTKKRFIWFWWFGFASLLGILLYLIPFSIFDTNSYKSVKEEITITKNQPIVDANQTSDSENDPKTNQSDLNVHTSQPSSQQLPAQQTTGRSYSEKRNAPSKLPVNVENKIQENLISPVQAEDNTRLPAIPEPEVQTTIEGYPKVALSSATATFIESNILPTLDILPLLIPQTQLEFKIMAAPLKPKMRPPFFIQLAGGYAQIHQTKSSASESEFYFNPEYGFFGKINLIHPVHKNISALLGLKYNHFLFSSQRTLRTEEILEGAQTVEQIDLKGLRHISQQNVKVSKVTRTDYINYQRFRKLDLLLGLGYEKKIGNFYADIYGQMGINLFNFYSGKFADTLQAKSDYWNSRNAWTAEFGLGLAYRVNPSGAIRLAYGYQTYFQSVRIAPNLSERIASSQIQLSYTIKF